MKNYFLSIFLVFVVTCIHAQNEMIVGTWQGFEDGDSIALTFDSDGYALLTFNHETIGGKSYDMGGLEPSLIYRLDTLKSPVWIDFVIVLKDGSELDFILGILEFSENLTEMEMCLNFDEGAERPNSFEEDDTVQMTRVD